MLILIHKTSSINTSHFNHIITTTHTNNNNNMYHHPGNLLPNHMLLHQMRMVSHPLR